MEERTRAVTRRRLLRTAGGLLVGLAAGKPSYFAPSVAAAKESLKPSLITRVTYPYHAETPARAFDSHLTPNDRFL
ncbi:MAG: hypothetical protein NW703_09840 [Nitrospiraceae bacterium]